MSSDDLKDALKAGLDGAPIDRSKWPSGPWEHEPDRLEWRHLGFPCLIVRQDLGALCGYVAVPRLHPWYGRSHDQIDASAHGGLSYSDRCASRICHVPTAGESDDVWWVGFDCCHWLDVVPGLESPELHRLTTAAGGRYRTIEEVKSFVEELAAQALNARMTADMHYE